MIFFFFVFFFFFFVFLFFFFLLVSQGGRQTSLLVELNHHEHCTEKGCAKPECCNYAVYKDDDMLE